MAQSTFDLLWKIQQMCVGPIACPACCSNFALLLLSAQAGTRAAAAVTCHVAAMVLEELGFKGNSFDSGTIFNAMRATSETGCAVLSVYNCLAKSCSLLSTSTQLPSLHTLGTPQAVCVAQARCPCHGFVLPASECSCLMEAWNNDYTVFFPSLI